MLETTTGYSVVLPGHPQIAATPGGLPTYDVVVKLRDAPVELGFRIDDVPATAMEPMAMAHAFALAYAKNRSVQSTRPTLIHPLPPAKRPINTIGGAHAVYGLRDCEADPVMEQVFVLLQPAPSGVWSLTHTTRFKTAELDVFEWANLRAAVFDQHHWDPEFPRDRPTPVWPPESEIAICGAKLALTPEGWQEAVAKAGLIGQLTGEHAMTLVEALLAFVQTNDPPRNRIHPMLFPLYMQRIAAIGPGNIAEAMLRNIERCLTTHDLRAWAWQCMWAIARQDKLAQLG
jgi:hypothetical protein